MDEKSINVVLAPDENYVVHAGVAMMSILRHARQPERFAFYFLGAEEGISAEAKKFLQEVVAAFQARLVFVRLVEEHENVASFKPGDSVGHVSTTTYYRLLIPRLLPELEYCIYLDCDVVALDDLAKLWEEDISDFAVGVVDDWCIERAKWYHFPQISRYFNSGVMYMNLRRWREKQYMQECLRLAGLPEMHFRFSDQDVLNVVFCKDRKFLHPRWNIQTDHKPGCKLRLTEQEMTVWHEIVFSPGIAHFTGYKKPWDYHLLHNWADQYWENLRATPWNKRCRGYWRGVLNVKFRGFMRWMLFANFKFRQGSYRLKLFGIPIINVGGHDESSVTKIT